MTASELIDAVTACRVTEARAAAHRVRTADVANDAHAAWVISQVALAKAEWALSDAGLDAAPIPPPSASVAPQPEEIE